MIGQACRKRRLGACSLLLCLLLGVAAAAADARNAVEQSAVPPVVVEAIDTALASPQLRGGIQAVIVESLSDGAVWYERNPDLLLIPASNQKLITTAAALALLGPEYRYRTSVVTATANLHDGTLRGDVYLKGSGDPFLDSGAVDELVKQMVRRGVRRIEGRIIGDGTSFPPPQYGYGWSWDDMSYYYSAPVSGLNLNRNVQQVTVSPGKRAGMKASVTITPRPSGIAVMNRTRTVAKGSSSSLTVERVLGRDVVMVEGDVPLLEGSADARPIPVTVERPALYAAEVLRQKLRAAGVVVSGKAAEGATPASASSVLASFESRPMSEIISLVNKPSDNLGAECLLRTIGLVRRGAGTVSAGREAVAEWLRGIGAPEDGLIIRDGSGLSRMNFVTANVLRILLRYMAKHEHRAYWYASLPVAGVDGTLRNRLRGTAAEGRVRAKTGYVSNVSSLSGYVRTKFGEEHLFVILMNNHACRNADATAIQDRIVRVLADYSGSQPMPAEKQ